LERLKQGDIIKINFDPILGHEQAGYRPAIIISNNFAISQTNMIFICPITNSPPKFPMHISIGDVCKNVKGTILCEHTRAVDLSIRKYNKIDSLPKSYLKEIIDIIYGLMEFS
jgi:mRNA interferase MazF